MLGSSPPSPPPMIQVGSLRGRRDLAGGSGFPAFLPKEVENIKDPYARALAQRIERLPVRVNFSTFCMRKTLAVHKILYKYLHF